MGPRASLHFFHRCLIRSMPEHLMSPTIRFVQPHTLYKLPRLIPLNSQRPYLEHYCLAELILSGVSLIQSCCCADPYAKHEVIHEFTHLKKSKDLSSYLPQCIPFTLLPAALYGVSHRVGSSLLRQSFTTHYCTCDLCCSAPSLWSLDLQPHTLIRSLGSYRYTVED